MHDGTLTMAAPAARYGAARTSAISQGTVLVHADLHNHSANVWFTANYTDLLGCSDMNSLYNWIRTAGAVAAFNHPGREPGRFNDFAPNAAVATRSSASRCSTAATTTSSTAGPVGSPRR